MLQREESAQGLISRAHALARSEPAKAYRLAQRALALTETAHAEPDQRATALRTAMQLAYEQKHVAESTRLQAALEALLPRCSPAVRARCKNGLGWDAYSRGDLGRALGFAREALAELSALGETEGELWARNNLAAIYAALGSKDKSVALYAENRQRSRALGSVLMEGGTLLNLAIEHNRHEDFAAALDAAEQSLPLLDACQDVYAQLLARAQIVNALLGLGRTAEAREKCDALLAMPCPMPPAAAMRRFYQARTLRYQGDFQAAAEAALEGLRHTPRALTPDKLNLWAELALAYEKQGQHSLAWRLNQKVLAGSERMKFSINHITALEALARLAEHRGRFKLALQLHKRLREAERAQQNDVGEKQRVMFSVELSLDRARQEAERARLRNAALQEAVSRDGMTGLYNHAAFQKMLQQHANRGPLALVMIDVDDFKQYNDNHGHPAGDALLKALAALLQAQLRDEDGLARYGGEEFALLLPGHDTQSAAAVAERLRRVVAAYPAPHRPVTVSLGVAATPPLPPDPQALVEAADRSLYEAKRLGKNRIVVSAELVNS